MALVFYGYGYPSEDAPKVDQYVDTSTGQLFYNMHRGDSENGSYREMVPAGKTWEYQNVTDASGKHIYGTQGYHPQGWESDEGGMAVSNDLAGYTEAGYQLGDISDPNNPETRLANYAAARGYPPKYDPNYGWVIPNSAPVNAIRESYASQFHGNGDFITNLIDQYAVPLMMAATGAGMAGLGGLAAEGAGAADVLSAAAPVSEGALAAADVVAPATAEGAAAAGDAYLPGALSNPLTQALPTIQNVVQAAATNAGMQLLSTGTIDPEKVLTSVLTGVAGSTLGTLAGTAAGNALDSNLARSIVSGAVSGATQASINGTDPVTGALASGAASGLGYEAKANGINIPQQTINAAVSSIATGAPLDKTLATAVVNMGMGAAKDLVSGLSSIDTQAPAPVETRTPIPPDTSALDAVDQSISTQTPEQLPPTTPVETAPQSPLDAATPENTATLMPDVQQTPVNQPTDNTVGITPDQGRTGSNAVFYDEEGNARDSSGEPVYGSHNDVLTDPVTAPSTTTVTPAVTTTVTPRTSSTTPSGGGVQTASSSKQNTQNTGIPWLTSPTQAGLLTVKKDKNMSLDQLLEQLNPSLSGNVPTYADGGPIENPFAPLSSALDPKKVASEFVSAKPTLLAYKKAVSSPVLSHAPLKNMYQSIARGMAEGGLPSKYEEATPKGHKPEFITGVTGFYADGKGTGQSDDIPALLHDGDYVMDAETVSALGDGSSKAGREVLEKFRNQVPHESKTGGSVIPAKIADGEYVFPAAFVTALGKGENKRGSEILDGLREKLRAHKRKAPLDKIPPKAKSPLEYLKSKV